MSWWSWKPPSSRHSKDGSPSVVAVVVSKATSSLTLIVVGDEQSSLKSRSQLSAAVSTHVSSHSMSQQKLSIVQTRSQHVASVHPVTPAVASRQLPAPGGGVTHDGN